MYIILLYIHIPVYYLPSIALLISSTPPVFPCLVKIIFCDVEECGWNPHKNFPYFYLCVLF